MTTKDTLASVLAVLNYIELSRTQQTYIWLTVLDSTDADPTNDTGTDAGVLLGQLNTVRTFRRLENQFASCTHGPRNTSVTAHSRAPWYLSHSPLTGPVIPQLQPTHGPRDTSVTAHSRAPWYLSYSPLTGPVIPQPQPTYGPRNTSVTAHLRNRNTSVTAHSLAL